MTKSSDEKVSSWHSNGTPACNVVQVDAKKSPEFIAKGISGRPSLRFANTEQFLTFADYSKIGKSFVGPLTVFLVGTTIAKGDVRILSAGAEGPGSCDYIDGKGFKITADAFPGNDPTKVAAVLKIRAARLDTPLAGFSIGNSWNGQGYAGDVAEILIYQGALSPTASSLIVDYLNEKYQLKGR